MAQKTNNSHDKAKERQSGLPVPIHPDDAKDKVFTAILKALIKMGNKPSSPKELANIIVKYKYATLGGATPFATVSSRISQHFKRAAEHNPPRAPLLAKHVDEKHSRKINYSLATESVSNNSEAETHDNDDTAAKHTSEDEQDDDIRVHDPTRTNSKIRRNPSYSISSQHDSDSGEEQLKKHKSKHHYQHQSLPTPKSSQQQQQKTLEQPPPDEVSEGEQSDYHEEMLKADDLGINVGSSRSTIEKTTKIDNNTSKLSIPQDTGLRKPSFSFGGDQELWTPFSFEHDFDSVFLHDTSTANNNSIPLNIDTPESISISELDNYFANSTTSNLSQTKRKSFSSTMLGPNDKSLLQKVLLASAARGVAEKNGDDKEAQKGKLETIKEVDSSGSNDTQKESTTTIKPSAFNTSNLMDVTNGEDFVKFEEDEKKEAPPVPSTSAPTNVKKMTEILPATPTNTSAAEILKSMNIQNLNLSALQQVTNNIPSLQHLSSTLDLAKTLAAYMQSLAKSASTGSSPSSSTHATDLKTILTRFPILEAFIKKDLTVAGTSTPPLVSPTTSEFSPNLVKASPPSFAPGGTEPIVHTLTPTNPPMYITLIDNVAVCVVVLAKTETTPEYRIMRRVDSGFINGTVLLTAGGIETESERSMILSFEMERVRMPKKKSPLFGTWIPLRRAQELAVTCSVQNKLGHFLDDTIDSLFPSPLPIPITPRKPIRDSRLTALALAALRSESAKSNEFIVPPISRQSSSSGSIASTQLQELLMSNPHKALKSFNEKNPLLLGRHDDKEEVSTLPPSVTTKQQRKHSANNEKEESDVDVVNNSDSSQLSSNEEESDHEAVTAAVTPPNRVPPTALNLEELLSRVASKQPLHIHPRDLQKKRRRHSVGSRQVDTDNDEDEHVNKKAQLGSRKKPGTGGKWGSSHKPHTGIAIRKSASVSGTTITIKRSPSIQKKDKVSAHKKATGDSHVVVQHKPAVMPSSAKSEAETSSPATKKDDDEDDEDIDIGGSDCDDDLR